MTVRQPSELVLNLIWLLRYHAESKRNASFRSKQNTTQFPPHVIASSDTDGGRSCCEYALSVDKQAMIFNHIYIVRLISIELADVNRRGGRRRFLQQPKLQQQNPYL